MQINTTDGFRFRSGCLLKTVKAFTFRLFCGRPIVTFAALVGSMSDWQSGGPGWNPASLMGVCPKVKDWNKLQSVDGHIALMAGAFDRNSKRLTSRFASAFPFPFVRRLEPPSSRHVRQSVTYSHHPRLLLNSGLTYSATNFVLTRFLRSTRFSLQSSRSRGYLCLPHRNLENVQTLTYILYGITLYSNCPKFIELYLCL